MPTDPMPSAPYGHQIWSGTGVAPHALLVNMPMPTIGVTIAILDSEGNVTIRVNQPTPDTHT